MTATESPPARSPARSRKLRWGLGLGLITLLGGTPLGWYLGARYVWFNIHEVVPGQVYRSAQPSPAFLRDVVADKHIKSILKLNSAKESDWSKAETQANPDGVVCINLPMGVSRLPTSEEMLKLLDAVDTAPRPLLIHCKIGADRTGVASVLVAMKEGKSFDEAVSSQLTWRYMHVGHWGQAVEDVFARYRADKTAANQPTGGWTEFRDWVRTSYHQNKQPRK
jgi:protein tyrosine/serine phosphatase